MEILRRPALWTARLGPVFLFLWTLLGGLSAPSWAADAPPADKLKSRLVFEIDDLRINVDVTAQADNRLVVTLRGDVDTDGEKRRILTQADGVVADSAKIRDRIFVKSPGESEAPEPETTDLWVLTYIRSRVSSASGDGALTTAAPDSVDTLVQTLNSVYGQPIVRRAGGGRLFLHGKQSQVLAVKRFLSLIDFSLAAGADEPVGDPGERRARRGVAPDPGHRRADPRGAGPDGRRAARAGAHRRADR